MIEYSYDLEINGLNLYAYCGNNPVMFTDPNGTNFLNDIRNFFNRIGNWINKNILKPIGDFFSKTFDAFIDVSYKVISVVEDFLFAGFESGVLFGFFLGNNNKPISFFLQKPSVSWKFWEYKIGVSIKFGNFRFSIGFSLSEMEVYLGWKESAFGIFAGWDKIGIMLTETKESVTYYNQYFVRTITLILSVFGYSNGGITIPAYGG